MPGTTAGKIYEYCNDNDFKCMVIADGAEPYDETCFAPGILREALTQIRGGTSGDFTLPYNILVIITGGQTVLIDAGSGEKARPDAGLLTENLNLAGIDTSDITDIVISHAHSDHINGLTDAGGIPVFANATIHIAQTEFDFWINGTGDAASVARLGQLKGTQKNAQEKLSLLKDRIRLFKSDEPLFDFLTPIAAPGHTPGHQMFEVRTPAGSFLHMADICHDAAVLFRKPEWGTVFDVNFDLAVQTRIAALKKLAASGMSAFGYHMPWPGFGKVIQEENAFTWVEAPFE